MFEWRKKRIILRCYQTLSGASWCWGSEIKDSSITKKDINEQLFEVITYDFRHQFVLVVQIEFRNVKDLLSPLGFDLQQCWEVVWLHIVLI